LRCFLEEDPWGRSWVSKFFRADFADDPVPELDLGDAGDQGDDFDDLGLEVVNHNSGESH
jgi:hypothetical protein